MNAEQFFCIVANVTFFHSTLWGKADIIILDDNVVKHEIYGGISKCVITK